MRECTWGRGLIPEPGVTPNVGPCLAEEEGPAQEAEQQWPEKPDE